LELSDFLLIFAARLLKENMERSQVIDSIRQVAASVLPKGSTLYLYGSRARGDNHEDSDWDLLLLLNNQGDSDEAFRQYAYPIIVRGYDLWQSFSVHTYSKDEWYNGPHPMFYYNVEHDKQLIYES
jgi:predicted nucleotidyltransferase